MTPLEELVDACKTDDIAHVQECMAACIAEHVDINDASKPTPLMVACHRRRLEVAEYLLQNGADVNVSDEYTGGTALHVLIRERDVNVGLVRLLLAHGADVMMVNDEHETALHMAMNAAFKRELVEMLLEAGADDSAAIQNGWQIGFTPLHQACLVFNLDGVEFLLRHGVDVNARDVHGATPLHIAAGGRSLLCVDLVELLLKHGANPSAVDNKGESILQCHFFLGMADDDVLRLLFKYGALAEDTPESRLLHWLACNEKSTEVFDVMLDNGIPINALDTDGNTVVHTTCTRDFRFSPSTVENLLNRGARDALVIENMQGYLPLHCAAEQIPTEMPHHDVQFLSILLKFGADVNARTRDGLSPLCLLLYHARLYEEGELRRSHNAWYECLRLLCRHGAVWDDSCERRLSLTHELINSSQNDDEGVDTLTKQVRAEVTKWRQSAASNFGTLFPPTLLLSGMRSCIQHWANEQLRGSSEEIELTEIPSEVYSRGDEYVEVWLKDLASLTEVQRLAQQEQLKRRRCE